MTGKVVHPNTHTIWIVAVCWWGSFSLEYDYTEMVGYLLDIERDRVGDDEAIAALALFERWQTRPPQLPRNAHHGRSLATLGRGEDLVDCCARFDSVDIVPLQVDPRVLKTIRL
ncbi:MAG: 2-phosphosulfolactate phosphatase [Candidatus Contendobacter sp.]